MKDAQPSRVRYFPQQYLRRQDFSDEQGYLLALGRRHNITHHSWGIVAGLEIVIENDGLVVLPGLAIDGYGRELLLRSRYGISKDQFKHLGSDRLDVWLYYESTPGSPAPPGFVGCDETDKGNYRFNETPRVFLERARSSRITKPPNVPDQLLNASAQLETPDNPLTTWPVYLGRVIFLPQEEDPAKQNIIDLSDRRYAGVVAEVVDHPATENRIQLGAMSEATTRRIGDKDFIYNTKKGRSFGIFVPDKASVGATFDVLPLDPRFSIDPDGNSLRGTTTVYGNVELPGGAIQFGKGEPENEISTVVSHENPSIYRVSDAAIDELRIDLGTYDETKQQKFVIGFTSEDGVFTPSITLEYSVPPGGTEPQALLTIAGDLKLDGLVECKNLLDRTLASETIAALIASLQSGTIAAG